MDTSLPEQNLQHSNSLEEYSTSDAINAIDAAEDKRPQQQQWISHTLQVIIAFALIVGAGFVFTFLMSDPSGRPPRNFSEQILTVETQTAMRQDHQPAITVFGDISAGNVIELRSELSGPLVQVHPNLKAGAIVHAGEVLAEIEPFDFEIAVGEAQANLTDARARIDEIHARITAIQSELSSNQKQTELAASDLQRAQTLISQGSVTQQAVDQRRQTFLQRQAAVDSTQANLQAEQARLAQQEAILQRLNLQLKQTERNLTQTRIIAPADAVVASESLSQGQLVTANTIMARLYDLAAFEVRFTLSEAQYGRLVEDMNSIIGQTVQLNWTVGARQQTLSAIIDRMAPDIRTETAGVTLFARIKELPPYTDLRPGAFVTVTLADKVYPDTFRIPETALYNENTLYIIDGDRLRAVPINVKAYVGEEVIIEGELENGADILINRIAEVGTGLKVRKVGQRLEQTGSSDHSSSQVTP